MAKPPFPQNLLAISCLSSSTFVFVITMASVRRADALEARHASPQRKFMKRRNLGSDRKTTALHHDGPKYCTHGMFVQDMTVIMLLRQHYNACHLVVIAWYGALLGIVLGTSPPLGPYGDTNASGETIHVRG